MKSKFLFVIILFLQFDLIVTAQRPNIVLVLIDDADENLLPPNTPDYVSVPNIKRIYEEGARFTNFYGVYPLCNPSRYSLLTGMYPHVHGATDNTTNVTNKSLPFFTSILQDAGYHNICIGKYSNVDINPPYFEKKMCVKKVDYTDPVFCIDGVKKTIKGNTTIIIDDTVRKWISQVDTPFFAWIGHIAPHSNVKVPDQDINAYENEDIPIPVNVDYFKNDFPSFLYNTGANYVENLADLPSQIESDLEALLEIDRGVKSIFDTLTKRGLLDNTLIVFTNDNGTFVGEHMLLAKGKPYEPATSLPLFIRYPKYFNPNQPYVNTQFLQSFDLTPTFLSVAGIDPQPYHFQGISLDQQLFFGKKRSSVFMEKILGESKDGEEPGDVTAPSWRAIRTKNYKYVRYQCDSSVEELFDMKKDSLETTNQIYNPDYTNALNKMRSLLASKTISTHDTLSRDTIIGDCYLVHHMQNELKVNSSNFELSAYPQPASDYIHLSVFSNPGSSEPKNFTIELLNEIGVVINAWKYSPPQGLDVTIDVRLLQSGVYFIRATSGESVKVIPINVQ